MTHSKSTAARIPLQTGASAVGKPVVFVLVYLTLCGAVTGLAFGPRLGGVAMLMASLFVPVIVLPIVLDWRASDLVLEAAGFGVRGGPFSGVGCAWADVDAANCRLAREDTPAVKSNVGNLYCYALTVATRDGSYLLVARATERAPEEVESLKAVRDIIVALATPPAPEAPVSLPSEVLTCPSCGGLAAPTVAATTRCAFCGSDVPVSEALRKRVEDAQNLTVERRRARALAARVIAQPHATAINVRLALLATLYCAAAAVGSLAAFQWQRADIALVALGVFVASFASVRASVADRVALRALALDFGARHAVREGAPERCRCCSAPLPAARPGEIVVGCVYCGAENVLGIDLRSDLSGARSTECELDWALSNRTAVHRRRAVALALALAVCALGAGVHFLG